ncbi:aldehyde dehydrogenase family protein [Oceanobacter mangrovi]|uniref:aldehyde dehydrogenase family protein n=1 Tax=Oceanobacter mangrovi TaxID=2862510 RepID=UPI001C8D8683|nr:aldehyde dehydrogenase family protein [Oceanobacter mangrovi]
MSAIMINNQWQTGNGPLLTSLNPATAEVVWQQQQASDEQVQQAVQAAKQAFTGWQALTFEQRQQVLQAFAEQLHSHQDELANIISLETGKPGWEAKTEVQAMINKVGISIEAAGERTQQQPQLAHRAHGVMAVFGPYNFPGHLPNGHIVPALLAGNTVVFKPSELTPWVAEFTVKLWQQAGLPAGVLNLLQGDVAVGKALCQTAIDGLLFTGSSTTGRLLHQQFGGRPEVLLALEMGGNNPLIIDNDINLDAAVELIIRSAFISAGQRCTCARRLILIDNPQTDQLLDKLVERCQQIRIGGQHDESFYGPVISARARDELLNAQQQLSAFGANTLLAMQHPASVDPAGENPASDDSSKQSYNHNSHTQGYWLTPGILDVSSLRQQPAATELLDQEWFGPLLQVYRVADFAAAIALANDTRFGLAAGLVSNHAEHQQVFKAEIRAGVISINQPTAGASSRLPFGGIGASGNHRPSAWYAADYCAWPQAISAIDSNADYQPTALPGLQKQ